jgi:preprotein translocase subunit SecF
MLFNIRPGSAKFRFMDHKWIAFILSAIFIVASLALIPIKGLNFGIDFTGGIVIEARTAKPIELSKFRKLLTTSEFGEISLQNFGSENDVLIRIQAQEGDSKEQLKAVQKVKKILSEGLKEKINYRKVDFVGPQVGEELIEAGTLSLIFAFLAIMAYIWIRFEWQFGVGAIVALIHDVTLTMGLFSLLEIEFNLTSIAAILTIVGYSINDSVVIYDRVRENMRKFKKMHMEELLNKSVNNTLSRTLLTAGSTIAALLALAIFGGQVLYGFSIAVLFGIVVGTYSSIYIAAPILLFMNVRTITTSENQS